MRTAKTMLAVLLSALLIRYVFHQNPFFACIGAVVAVEKTMKSSVRAAMVRNIGTISGGLIGIAVATHTQNMLLMTLGLIPFIWLNNIIGEKQSIVPGAIVYFAVFFLNTMDSAMLYGITRILGTLAGTFIGLAVNLLVFPPKEEEDS